MDIAELRFLIVEDQGVQRVVLVNTLEGLGARHVIAAEDGRVALELLHDRDRTVDVIISDLDMPEMDGMELIRHLGEDGGDYSLIVASALDRSILSSVEAMARSYGVRLLGAIEKPICAELRLPPGELVLLITRVARLGRQHIARVTLKHLRQRMAFCFSGREVPPLADSAFGGGDPALCVGFT